VVKAASLHETGADFTEPQKQIINKELKEIVLHPDQVSGHYFSEHERDGEDVSRRSLRSEDRRQSNAARRYATNHNSGCGHAQGTICARLVSSVSIATITR
jgi:hypothetical protein